MFRLPISCHENYGHLVSKLWYLNYLTFGIQTYFMIMDLQAALIIAININRLYCSKCEPFITGFIHELKIQIIHKMISWHIIIYN